MSELAVSTGGPVVVVAGAIANKPGNAGEVWVRRGWVEGLRRAGADVWFVEELAPSAWPAGAADNIAWFDRVLPAIVPAGRALLWDRDTRSWLRGRSADPPDADLLVNISGHLREPALLSRCRRRAFVDLDPGYTQVWHAQGARLGLGAHQRHFSVGLNLGQADCTIPTGGYDWMPVLPPVVRDEWRAVSGDRLERFTSIASWRGGSGPLDHEGVRYGVKAHAFRRLIDLPSTVEATIELALEIHAGDEADRRSLLDHGWVLRRPSEVAGDPDSYRRYISASSAELSVCQGVYAGARTGWVSDRTAHYLAAGRPALVQDTGLARSLPVGEGLVLFAGRDDAIARAHDLQRDYRGHHQAALALAERFDAEQVAERFLDQALG